MVGFGSFAVKGRNNRDRSGKDRRTKEIVPAALIRMFQIKADERRSLPWGE